MNVFFIVWLVGLVLWIAETAFFGFNATPQSEYEKLADGVAWAMMVFGGLGAFVVAAVKVGLTEYERITNERSKRVIDEMKSEADRLTNFRVADTNRRKEDLDRAVSLVKEMFMEMVTSGEAQVVVADEDACLANEGMLPQVIRDHHEMNHCKEHRVPTPDAPVNVPVKDGDAPEAKPAGKKSKK